MQNITIQGTSVQGPKPEGKCPKCGAQMRKYFASISGNAKYMEWQCEECGNKVLKCIGLVEKV